MTVTLDTTPATVVSADGTPIAYTATGTGPAVVFVDGALCHRAFGPGPALAAELAAHHTVHTYDRRGRGDSGDTAPFDVEREIEDLAAVIAAAGGTAYVVGMSSGSALALRAATAGIGVRKVAVYEPPFTTDDDGAAHFADYVRNLRTALAEDRYGDAVAELMLYAGAPAPAVEQMRAIPLWPAFEAVAPTLAYDAEALGVDTGAAVPVGLLADITVPVLAVDGGASPETLRAPTRAVAAATPTARYATLPDQTHEVAPAVLAPVLTDFFA
ncbi:alpha/beta fold hydrolase [Embleya sp. NPDC050493]|uniref:alpha/beta fold hydrolase n=1 Tax=Embleya sp. NPDC050493 TaxID=3363989 RepID=UPI0037B5A2F4